MKTILLILLLGIFFTMWNPLAFASETETNEPFFNGHRGFMGEMHPELSTDEIDERISSCHGSQRLENQR